MKGSHSHGSSAGPSTAHNTATENDKSLVKTSDLLVDSLVREGVQRIYAIPGEENLDVLESIRKSGKIQVVLVRHEQAGGFMAATEGRLLGKVGVAMSTLGPGATNFTTSAAYANLAGFPCLFLTGQKGIRDTKQSSFQIVDIVEMMRPLTKFTKQITDGNVIASSVRKAFRLAAEEKPGPVHLELPEDIASEMTEPRVFEPTTTRRPLADDKAILSAVEVLKHAKRPLFVIGGGCNRQRAVRSLHQFAEELNVFVVCTQMGKGVFAEDSACFIGCAALSSRDYVHVAIELADVIINIGSDSAEKPPFFMTQENSGVRKVIHVSFHPAMVDNVYFPHVEVVGDVANAIWRMKESLIAAKVKYSPELFRQVKVEVSTLLKESADDDAFPMNITRVVKEVRKAVPRDGIVSLDNGFYKVWFARLFETYEPNTLLLDNCLATMGAGLPVGIAASMVKPERNVLVVSGDGGWTMNAPELATAMQYKVNLVCVILNDSAYGMIEWKQNNMGFDKWGLGLQNPDFVAHAKSYGAGAVRISSPDELVGAIQDAFKAGGLQVIEVPVDYAWATENLKQVPQVAADLSARVAGTVPKPLDEPLQSMAQSVGSPSSSPNEDAVRQAVVMPTESETKVAMHESYSIQKGSKVPIYLGGKPIQPNSDLKVTDKYTQQVYCEVALADTDHLEEATALAHGIGSEKMKALKSFERKQILLNAVAQFKQRFEEFAMMLCIEAGKPINDARGEVGRLISTFEIAAEESVRIYGEYQPMDINQRAAGYSAVMRRFPAGPVSMISPFNFPLNLAAHKIAPAIAAGVSFVLKPASRTPLGALLIAQVLASDPLMPKEGFSILPCSREAGDILTVDSRFKVLSFTGSPGVGWPLKEKAGKKKVVLELGGNAACVIDDLKVGLDSIVQQVVHGSFYQSGQSCISVQRILVAAPVYEEFKTAFVNAVKSLKMGDPKVEGNFIGPLISKQDAERIKEWVDEAVEGGGKLLCGGEISEQVFLSPAVVENVPQNCRLFMEEVFGTAVGIERYDSFKQAIKQVNNSKFGLQAGVFTTDLHKANYAYEQIDAGAICINSVPSVRIDSQWYGGVKDSGFGFEGIRAAILDYTEVKTMMMKDVGNEAFIN